MSAQPNSVPATEQPLPDGSAPIKLRFATKYGIHPRLLFQTLRETAFKQDEGKEVTDAQLMALLVVADQFGLNPFTREIFAFWDSRKGIIPVVSIDGWVRIINDHPSYDGVEFAYSDEMVEIDHGAAPRKKAHVWVEAIFYRKDIGRPIRVREYLDEVYQPPRGQSQRAGPWQSHPKRFQRHKALIQGARVALGFGGIFDEDEAARIEQSLLPPPVNTESKALEDDIRRAADELQAGKQAQIEAPKADILGEAIRIDTRELDKVSQQAVQTAAPQQAMNVDPADDQTVMVDGVAFTEVAGADTTNPADEFWPKGF